MDHGPQARMLGFTGGHCPTGRGWAGIDKEGASA